MFKELMVCAVKLDRALPKESYLRSVPAIGHLQTMGELCFEAPVTFLVGENGIGKSTLLEGIALALGFNAEGGTVNFQFSTKDSHSDLHDFLTVSKGVKQRKDGFFLRAESFYNVASYVDQFGERALRGYGGESLHQQSHGESFMALVENRFGGNGLYLLDEPEAALSPSRQMELLCHIHRLVREGSQFIISTHSPILMAYPNGQVLNLTKEGIEKVSYQETEHFRLTKQFLSNPERMCQLLFSEE